MGTEWRYSHNTARVIVGLDGKGIAAFSFPLGLDYVLERGQSQSRQVANRPPFSNLSFQAKSSSSLSSLTSGTLLPLSPFPSSINPPDRHSLSDLEFPPATVFSRRLPCSQLPVPCGRHRRHRHPRSRDSTVPSFIVAFIRASRIP